MILQTLIETIRAVLQNECRLDPEKPVLAGVSGGPDSLCLLDILVRLRYPVVVAHLDHGLRPESGMEARIVEEMAASRGLRFRSGREDVAAYAALNGLSIEEAARNVRYHFLFHEARLAGAQAVAVGHTADDQVETVLMHLLRGAGLSGLKGMAYRTLPSPWSQEIALVRPLLAVWREQVLNWISLLELQPNQDISNLDTRFYRNRLRHELIPYLQTYNPRVREAIWRTAQVLGEDYTILEQMTSSAWEDGLVEHGSGFLVFDLQVLKGLPLGIQRHLLRRAIGNLRPGLRDLDFVAIDRAVSFLAFPSTTGQLELPGGLRLLRETRRIWLSAWEADLPGDGWPQLPDGAQLRLDVPGRISMPEGWQLRAEPAPDLAQAQAKAAANANPYQAWVDAAELELPLLVRARRPGERFQPLGLQGHSLKLSDFWINAKLPRRARAHWPLVCKRSGKPLDSSAPGEIVWVPGFRLAYPFRLRPETREAIHLELVHDQDT